ncbi:MAG TPA: DinB family protein [Longimicrobium sp.]|nr:DinB family protein [Longimicrobium sp.]
MAADTPSPAVVLTPEQLLKHWQGHRGLTRRVIEAFPEDALFNFTLGGMRPFSALAWEFLRMAVPTVRGVVTGEWSGGPDAEPTTKADILRLWDEDTAELERLWPKIAPHRFQESELAFGQWEGPVYNLILYVVDNEIHHRGQGYVYLRALGIEPPAFYDRQ